jgi:hypothetical protein
MPKFTNAPCISSMHQCKLSFNQKIYYQIVKSQTCDDATSPKGRIWWHHNFNRPFNWKSTMKLSM